MLAEISDATWASLILSGGTLATLIVKAIFDQINRVQDRLDRKAATAEIKQAGLVRESNIVAKIDENTAITKEHGEAVTIGVAMVSEMKDHLEMISRTGEFRKLIHSATKPSDIQPVYHMLTLPGADYEVFPLTEEGGQAEWRSEVCAKGRQVRFRCLGPCRMGLHFHRLTAEFLFMVDGDLILETANHVVHLKKGDSYQTPADMVHSASIQESGEVLCTWIDLESDELEIGIFPPTPSGTVTTTTTTTITP